MPAVSEHRMGSAPRSSPHNLEIAGHRHGFLTSMVFDQAAGYAAMSANLRHGYAVSIAAETRLRHDLATAVLGARDPQ